MARAHDNRVLPNSSAACTPRRDKICVENVEGRKNRKAPTTHHIACGLEVAAYAMTVVLGQSDFVDKS
jgi:hypothetical protein